MRIIKTICEFYKRYYRSIICNSTTSPNSNSLKNFEMVFWIKKLLSIVMVDTFPLRITRLILQALQLDLFFEALTMARIVETSKQGTNYKRSFTKVAGDVNALL